MQPKIVYRLAVVVAVLVVASASVISIKLMAHASQDQPFVLQGQYVPLTAHAQIAWSSQWATAIEPFDRVTVAQPAGTGYRTQRYV